MRRRPFYIGGWHFDIQVTVFEMQWIAHFEVPTEIVRFWAAAGS